MFATKRYRAKSDEYREPGKGSTDPSQVRKYQDLSDGFSSLAENEARAAGNPDKTLQALDEEQADDATLAAEEEHVLRCLGAAVIMQWNTIPTKLRREFFDTAGSMGELLATAELRGQIARFLHKHKDRDTVRQNAAPLSRFTLCEQRASPK